MPPEQQDRRDRQLEVLRRYVADLSSPTRRDVSWPPAPPEPDEEWQLPGGPVLLAVLVLVSAALLGGFLIGRASLPDSTAPAAAATSVPGRSGAAAPAASPECKTAVDHANRSLALAVQVQGRLAEHTRIMQDLADGRIGADTALRTGMRSLEKGAAESSRFDDALAAYQQVVDECELLAR